MLVCCVYSAAWAVVRDSHGSAIPLITTAAWRNRLPFSATVTEKKRSQVDKLSCKFNILLVSATHSGVQEVSAVQENIGLIIPFLHSDGLSFYIM